jgi:hypothetical protein
MDTTQISEQRFVKDVMEHVKLAATQQYAYLVTPFYGYLMVNVLLLALIDLQMLTEPVYFAQNLIVEDVRLKTHRPANYVMHHGCLMQDPV